MKYSFIPELEFRRLDFNIYQYMLQKRDSKTHFEWNKWQIAGKLLMNTVIQQRGVIHHLGDLYWGIPVEYEHFIVVAYEWENVNQNIFVLNFRWRLWDLLVTI